MGIVCEVEKVGRDILKRRAEDIDFSIINFSDIELIVQKMIRTFRSIGGVGISAPQIGISKRIIIMQVTENSVYLHREAFPLTVMINPQYISTNVEVEDGYEGCLSVPGIRGIVSRYKEIQVKYYNIHGREQKTVLSNFPAKILQHEVDHLDGLTFLDRVVDTSSYITEENFMNYVLPLDILKSRSRCNLKVFDDQMLSRICDVIEVTDVIRTTFTKRLVFRLPQGVNQVNAMNILVNKLGPNTDSRGRYIYNNCKIQYNYLKRKITVFLIS